MFPIQDKEGLHDDPNKFLISVNGSQVWLDEKFEEELKDSNKNASRKDPSDKPEELQP